MYSVSARHPVAPGATAPLHKHTIEETMLVLEGTVWVRIGDERYTVGPQHTVIIPAEITHAWGNSGPDVAKLLWAFGGPDPFQDSTYLEGTPPPIRPPTLERYETMCRNSSSVVVSGPLSPTTR